MRALYETGAYYVQVPAGSADFEENYWGTVVDPDGNCRDRSTERDQYLQDIRTEREYIAQLPPQRMLDVGCGLGWLMSSLPAWETYGIETSRFAAKRAAQHGTVHVGTLQDCPFPKQSFQLVTMHHVIEHVPDPMDAILRIKQLIAPGGTLILSTPDFDSGCARRFKERYRLLHDPTHISLFFQRFYASFLTRS